MCHTLSHDPLHKVIRQQEVKDGNQSRGRLGTIGRIQH